MYIKVQIALSNFILRKEVDTVLDLTISFALAILHVRKQQVISPDALAVEKFRKMEIISNCSFLKKSRINEFL